MESESKQRANVVFKRLTMHSEKRKVKFSEWIILRGHLYIIHRHHRSKACFPLAERIKAEATYMELCSKRVLMYILDFISLPLLWWQLWKTLGLRSVSFMWRSSAVSSAVSVFICGISGLVNGAGSISCVGIWWMLESILWPEPIS